MAARPAATVTPASRRQLARVQAARALARRRKDIGRQAVVEGPKQVRRHRRAGDEIAERAGRDHQETGELLVGQRRGPAAAPGEARAGVEVPSRKDEKRSEQTRQLAGDEQCAHAAPAPGLAGAQHARARRRWQPQASAAPSPVRRSVAATGRSGPPERAKPTGAASARTGQCKRPRTAVGRTALQPSGGQGCGHVHDGEMLQHAERQRPGVVSSGTAANPAAIVATLNPSGDRSPTVGTGTPSDMPQRRPRFRNFQGQRVRTVPARCMHHGRPRSGTSRRERVRPSFVPKPRRALAAELPELPAAGRYRFPEVHNRPNCWLLTVGSGRKRSLPVQRCVRLRSIWGGCRRPVMDACVLRPAAASRSGSAAP